VGLVWELSLSSSVSCFSGFTGCGDCCCDLSPPASLRLYAASEIFFLGPVEGRGEETGFSAALLSRSSSSSVRMSKQLSAGSLR
jgi:hypothetical protein